MQALVNELELALVELSEHQVLLALMQALVNELELALVGLSVKQVLLASTLD
jgi:hypothetical protein